MAEYMKDSLKSTAVEDERARLRGLEQEGTISKKQQRELHALDAAHQKEILDAKKKQAKEDRDEMIKALEQGGDVIGAASEKIKKSFEEAKESFESGEFTSGLTKQLDSIIEGYVSKQTQMTAHLIGTNISLNDITRTLGGALSATNLVRQEAVYNKLSDLLSNGITYNVEQRAFLQTLAEDIDITFNATNGTLTQLIRLQREDLTSNRLAIEYSLQEFLNQNYNTSEYIKDAFTGVSDALLTSQSLFDTASAATQYEAMVQSWLGSYYSAGVSNSTVTNLASAINALGSGDVSGLGKGISNLVLMGVARAGLDYGELLTNGINADNVDQIMLGITEYLTEMGANSSNVARSQLSTLFGVNISDLVAMKNLNSNAQGGVTTDINTALLDSYGNLVAIPTQISNVLNNMMYAWGTNIASSTGNYLGYQVEKLLASSGLGSTLDNLGDALMETEVVGKAAGLALNVAGIAINNAPLLSLLTSGTLGDWASSLGNMFSGAGGLSSVFSSLGESVSGSLVKMSGAGLSQGLYIGSGSTDDLLNSYKGSANDALGNYINVEQEGPTVEENVATITENVVNIYSLLETKLDTIIAGIAASNPYSAAASAVVNYSGGFIG